MSKQSPSIFILHGWAVDKFNEKKWVPFMDGLKKQGVETKFLGIPGLTTPLDEVWQLDDFVTWLDTQLPKSKKVILLGHSFGGQIATRFTARFPERVERLILVDSAGIRDKSLKIVLKRQVFWLLAKVGKVFSKSGISRKILYKLARERDYFTASPLLRKTMSNVLADEVKGELDNISCPTLVVWGRDDTATPLKLGLEFHDGISGSKLAIIDGARHSPQFTHTGEVVEVVLDWL